MLVPYLPCVGGGVRLSGFPWMVSSISGAKRQNFLPPKIDAGKKVSCTPSPKGFFWKSFGQLLVDLELVGWRVHWGKHIWGRGVLFVFLLTLSPDGHRKMTHFGTFFFLTPVVLVFLKKMNRKFSRITSHPRDVQPHLEGSHQW